MKTAEGIAKNITQYWLEVEPLPKEFEHCLAQTLKDYRNAALEEAAKIVDRHERGEELCAEGVANRIRALKTK